MKKVIITDQNTDVVDIKNVSTMRPVFVKQEGQFIGMIMNDWEDDEEDLYYVQCGPEIRLRIVSGIHGDLMKKLIEAGYELFIEDYDLDNIIDDNA